MKENNTQALLKSDGFLNKIRRQILMLGIAATASLLYIGVTAFLTMWRSNINTEILNYMNTISTSQYEIRSDEEESFNDRVLQKTILNSFEKMRVATETTLTDIYTEALKDDIRILSRDIKNLTNNYKKLLEISTIRGFTETSGLYQKFTENNDAIYTTITSLAMRESKPFSKGKQYVDTLYSLTSQVFEYTSDVIDGKRTYPTQWELYGSMRFLEQNLKVEAATYPELKNVVGLISKNREILRRMVSQDMSFSQIRQNSEKLHEHVLTVTNRIRSEEEKNTSSEQNSLLLIILVMILILVVYLFLHALKLRRDMSQSIQVFNELLVVKAANDAQSSFLSTVSHEIRTPINAIMGMNEIIIRETNNKQIQRYALEIKDSSRTLLSLVNDLLDSSRLDADRLKIIPVEYDLASSISDLTNMIASRAREKNLNLFINVSDSLPHMLFGDEIRIKQCVLNLLTNAVKYTESGSITLNVDYETVNRGSILLHFQVIDTGIGMKEEDLARIFDRFTRFEEKKNRNIEGTGLGMNIVNRLLALMGSRLEIHSIYGKGSDFSFSVHQGVINWDPIGDYNSMYEKSLEARKTYHEKLRAPAARLLVVDDMKVNLTVFRGLLKKTGIQIDTALSGKTAIEMIKNNSYDMVFLDHRMPKMDGLETLINIRELPNNPNRDIPYVALTANAIAGARELYINAGFTDYLSKPIDSTELENMLVEYLPKDLVELQEADDIDLSVSGDDWINDNAMDMANYDDDDSTDSLDEGDSSADDKIHDILMNLEGVDYASAIENCVEDETLIEAMEDFIQSIETKPGEIETYWLNKDWRNYTIQVHALKSTARLIGANKLSEDAFILEQCGDAEDEESINEKTDALLDLYESYKEKLKPFIEARASAREEATAGAEPIPDSMFNDALGSIRELIDSFDFGNAEEILKMLENYDLTSGQQVVYDTLHKMIRDVDRDAVLSWFEHRSQGGDSNNG